MFSVIVLLFYKMLLGIIVAYFGEMLSRCYDDGVHADEELYPALNESNPVLKNKKVSRVRFTYDVYFGVTFKAVIVNVLYFTAQVTSSLTQNL